MTVVDHLYDYQVISAAKEGELDELRSLLKSGGDPNAEYYITHGENLFTALGEAFASQQYAAMDMLLSHGANPDAPYDFTAHIIHAIAWGGDEKALDILWNYEPDLSKQGKLYFSEGGKRSLHEPMTAREVAEKRGHEGFVAQLERYAAIPAVGDARAVTKEDLLRPNANGDCMLDHPSCWRQVDEVFDSLWYQKAHLTKAELLPHMERAVACGKLQEVLHHLNDHGEALRTDDLLTVDGKRTPLLETVLEKGQADALFKLDNWRDCHVDDVTRLYKALPAKAQESIPNYFSLRTRLSLNEMAQGAGRSMRGGM